MTDRFYLRWILANAIAEGAGLGTTLILGVLAGQTLDRQPGPTAIVIGALVAILLGVALEGILVGLLQGWAIRERAPGLKIRDWTVATAWGAGLAWILGMVPSTTISLLQSGDPGNTDAPFEPWPWLLYTLAALMGAILGPILGLAQARVLRRFGGQGSCWLWANAAGWAVGMPLVFAGMHVAPWEAGLAAVCVFIVTVCTLVGAVVGAIHGWYLCRILSAAGTPVESQSSNNQEPPSAGRDSVQ